jgi:hypothetical protein
MIKLKKKGIKPQPTRLIRGNRDPYLESEITQ